MDEDRRHLPALPHVADLRARLQQALGADFPIDRELGVGMSRVFVAEDRRLARQVVVKVLPPDLAGGVNVARFEREIRLAAHLQHPHIVPLLFAGSAGHLPYYVMPYIEGESLRTRLARERELPIPEVVRLLGEVLDALEYAHQRGVVHRDIKPDDILLTGHHAVVADFGLAKAVSDATSDVRLTSTGVALGTPAYMAPEQIAGETDVDRRADIYATGLTTLRQSVPQRWTRSCSAAWRSTRPTAGSRRARSCRCSTRSLALPGTLDVATPKLAPVWRRVGELQEARGNVRQAIAAYEQFLGYWKDADAELQPIVLQVRERVDRLRRVTG